MSSSLQADKKMGRKDFIYTCAFGVLYIVLTLIIVRGSAAISPILHFTAPLTVGLVCGTVYIMCMLKVHKFGAALIFGGLFTLTTCYHSLYAIGLSLATALTAELILFLGKYTSRKMYLLSFVFFNVNMAAPTITMRTNFDRFIVLLEQEKGFEYAQSFAKLAFHGKTWYVILVCAVAGGIAGAFIANNLVKQHFEKVDAA
jgi:hypothetical protein